MTSMTIRRAFLPLLILAALIPGIKTDTALADATANKYWAQSLSFAESEDVLPRMAHPVLHINSTGVSALDITIAHVGEGDVLADQFSPHSTPPDAEIVWHKKVDIAAAPGEASITPVNILQAVGALKTGLYFITARDAGAHPAPALTATKAFTISNLGLQSFTGQGGITAQVRLLSTLGPAPGVDVALIAPDNREIARARTDNLGFVHFDATPAAALYAYGADGEFTPLFLTPYQSPKAQPVAWLEIEKTGGMLKGLAILRDANGNAVSPPNLYAAVRRKADGGIAAAQNPVDTGGGAYTFTLPLPKLPGPWQVALYQKNGDQSPDTLLAERALDLLPAKAAGNNDPQPVPAPIILSPGRRSFQPGAPADISVQPPFDADVSFIVATDAVQAALDQHIGKDGAAIQVPMPATAAGAYVIASAFAFADKDGSVIAQSANDVWLDADKGDKRLGVKIDAPENAAPGATLSVGVSLTNFDSQPAFVSLAVLPAEAPGLPDPLAYFLGQTPLSIAINSSYAGAPVLQNPAPPASAFPAPLLWTSPVAVDADGKVSLPVTLPNMPAKLRLYVVSWSASRLGLGASEITLAGKPAAKSSLPAAASKPLLQAEIVPPGGSRKILLPDAYISAAPILALPVSVDKSGGATFIDPNAPALNAVIESALSPLKDDKLLQTAYILQRFQDAGAAVPQAAMTPLLDKVAALAANPKTAKDQALFADYILFTAGVKDKHDIGAALDADPRPPATALGNAALAALDANASDAEDAANYARKSLTLPADGQDARLFTLLLLNAAKQPVKSTELKSLAARYPVTQARESLTALAVTLAAAIPAADAGPYKLRLNGKEATASGMLYVQRDPATPPLVLNNPGPAPLYLAERQ